MDDPVLTVRDPRDGMSATVFVTPLRTWRVVFRDDDSGRIVETRVFLTRERAEKYARRLFLPPVPLEN